jgi:hypothetical protein
MMEWIALKKDSRLSAFSSVSGDSILGSRTLVLVSDITQ